MDKEFMTMMFETLNQNIITIEHNLKTMKSMINSIRENLSQIEISEKEKKNEST